VKKRKNENTPIYYNRFGIAMYFYLIVVNVIIEY